MKIQISDRVVPYARDSGRTMHRTTIAGNEAVSA
jgi:hypothetical protein